MTLPHFIGAGVQRAATTWVYQCLKEHPQIFMPDVKEIHFFDQNYEKGVEWYKKFFKGANKDDVVGEITPNYINVPEALPRIAHHIPEARIFVILREPISRAYSAYKLLNEQFGHMSFEEACKTTDYFLSRSLYANDLKRLYSLFPEKQIKILLYDDVKKQPYKLLKELFIFLDVDETFIPKSATNVYNAIIMPRFQETIIKLGGEQALNFLKNTYLGQKLKSFLAHFQRHKIKKHQSEKSCLIASPEYLRYLKEYFRNDILEVQQITGLDLSSWLEQVN